MKPRWKKPKFKKRDHVRFGSKIFQVIKVHLLSGNYAYELNNGELAGAKELKAVDVL